MLLKNMKSSTGAVLFWCIAPLIIGFPIPSLAIFYLEVFVAHTSSAVAFQDVLHQQFADSLFFLAIFSLIPFAALSVLCFIFSHKFSPARLACLGIFGLIGIVAFMIPCHLSVWYPHYSGVGRMSSTAVIAFFFIPFYCLIPMGVGLLIGWWISLLFRSKIPQ